MIRDLTLTRFRSLRSFSVPGLTRVSLFLGGNNAGKTSVLEAAELLLGGPRLLWRSPSRRDEFLPEQERTSTYGAGVEADIRHLFCGHALQLGSSFRIESSGWPARTFACEVVSAHEAGDSDQAGLALPEVEPLMAVRVEASNPDRVATIPLTAQGGLHRDTWRRFLQEGIKGSSSSPVVSMISPSTADTGSLGVLWDRIVLTPEEDRVIEALRIIEPEVERLAAISRARDGLLVKLRDMDMRIPLGSMGDGIRYLLTLAMHLVYVSGGCLLVDEIDTGLHYSVMEKLWRLVLESARRLDVQVIASTHSLDCLRSLASVCRTSADAREDVSVHRVNRGTVQAIRYSSDELQTAVREEMEIR